jgi:hypothetical protein
LTTHRVEDWGSLIRNDFEKIIREKHDAGIKPSFNCSRLAHCTCK